jgi:hypothetical protein
METSEPGANRDTGVPTGRNTTLSIDYQQYVSITSLLSTDLGQSLPAPAPAMTDDLTVPTFSAV